MDYDLTNSPAVYNRGRDHGPAVLRQWLKVVASHIQTKPRIILDLGCGTGRFSTGLATEFDSSVIGIDPSSKMLREAFTGPYNRHVCYVGGAAEALPLPANSVDMIFISMAFHHFKEPHKAAQECRRVLGENGRVCLRTGSSDRISLYPYVPFFPGSRNLLEQRLPSLEFQCSVFEAASFRTLVTDVITQQIAPDYSAYADKLAVKADSILIGLNDEEFDAGMSALRSKAATSAPIAVTEPIDFIVFG
jgi:ubiquinone/menaquinone biosynthesis C-methylase UbiE